MRLVGPTGTLVMPHLHSALGENVSAGMTLTPADYADLFAPLAPRLFSDRTLFDALVDDAVVDLSRHVSAEALGTEPSLTLVASRTPEVFRRHSVPPLTAVRGTLAVNPLYARARADGVTTLTLDFPTPDSPLRMTSRCPNTLFTKSLESYSRPTNAAMSAPIGLSGRGPGHGHRSRSLKRLRQSLSEVFISVIHTHGGLCSFSCASQNAQRSDLSPPESLSIQTRTPRRRHRTTGAVPGLPARFS